MATGAERAKKHTRSKKEQGKAEIKAYIHKHVRSEFNSFIRRHGLSKHDAVQFAIVRMLENRLFDGDAERMNSFLFLPPDNDK